MFDSIAADGPMLEPVSRRFVGANNSQHLIVIDGGALILVNMMNKLMIRGRKMGAESVERLPACPSDFVVHKLACSRYDNHELACSSSFTIDHNKTNIYFDIILWIVQP